MKNLVWYVGGNSAGHIIPLRTLGEQYAGRAVFFTADSDLDRYLMRDYAHEHKTLTCSALPARWYQIPIFLIRFMRDCAYVAGLLWRDRPAYVLTSGGFLAIPVILVAWAFRVPCDLFELNVVPGRAVKFLVPFARTVYYCFHDAKPYFPAGKAVWRAYPVRIHAQTKHVSAACITIAVLGGSQGSRFLNTFVPQFLETWSLEDRQKIHIIHQTGQHECARVRAAYQALGVSVQVQPYFDRIQEVYVQADRVICRAGAGTLWELVHHTKVSLVIPLRTQATDHQVANAQAICRQYPDSMWLLEQEQVPEQYQEIKNWLLAQAPKAQERVDPQATLAVR